MLCRVGLLPALLICLAGFQAMAESSDSVLARMDKEALSFRDMTAKLRKVSFTAVLNDTGEESGVIWMKRAGSNKALMRVEITEPEPRSVGLEGSTAQIYYPKIQTVQIYDLGKNSTLLDQFSLLGFGTARKDLEKNYTIRVAGEETVEGQPSTRLELTPKSPKVLERVQKIELWIPANAGHPVRQKFNQPGGDYYLISYSDMKLNPSLPDSAFRLKLPKGVKREYPSR